MLRFFVKPFYFLLLWLSGIYLPVVYIIFIISFPRLLYYALRDLIVFYFGLLIILQVVSSIASLITINPFFSTMRFLAIFHNYFCMLLIPVSYILLKENPRYRDIFWKNIPVFFWLTASLSIALFLLALKFNTSVKFPNILFFLKSKYSLTQMVKEGYILDLTVPRVTLFGIYPNSTAIFMYIIYSLYLIYLRCSHASLFFRLVVLILSVISIITTGSRIVFIVFLIVGMIILLRNRKHILILISIIFLIVVINYSYLDKIVTSIALMRESSNQMRFFIYSFSLQLWEHFGPMNGLLGLGLKPYVDELGVYPVGSHSTFIGIFVKGGLIAGFLAVQVILYFAVRTLVSLVFSRMYRIKNYLDLTIFGLLVILFFEDVDAYEVVALYVGFLIALWRVAYDKGAEFFSYSERKT